MKILHITASYKPAYIYGGPIMSVAKLCEALILKKTNLKALTTTANGKEELNVEHNKFISVDGVPVKYFKRITKDHSHFAPSLLLTLRKEILRDIQNDKMVIHIHAWWNLVSVLSCLIAKWYKIPVLLSPRGMLTEYTLSNRNSISKRLIHHLLGERLLNYCHIHATSNQEKAEILEYINPKSFTIIPNLVSLPILKVETKKIKSNCLKIIFLSRIEEKKGLELLFEALAKIDFNFILSLAGSGELTYINQLKQKAENLNISGKISWLGHISNDDKFKLVAKHDLFTLTSYNENFANVIIESLHAGTPVLISKNVGLADYVEKNNFGWISELDVYSIANNLNTAYKDDVKRNTIRINAPKKIAIDFDTECLVSKYLELYNSITKIK